MSRIPLDDPFINRVAYAPPDYAKRADGPVWALPIYGVDSARPLGYLYTDRGQVLGVVSAADAQADEFRRTWTEALRNAYEARTPTGQVFDYWTQRDPGRGWGIGEPELVRGGTAALRERLDAAWR